MNKSKLFDSDVKHQRRIPECSRNDYIEKIRGKIQENNYKLLSIMFTSDSQNQELEDQLFKEFKVTVIVM